MKVNNRRKITHDYQALEKKELLAGDVFLANFNGGVQLTVIGTESGDVISVGGTSNTTVNINGMTSSFNTSDFDTIAVQGRGGNDRITISHGSLGATVFGQNGNDIITGGSFGDSLFGGAGVDTIQGNNGNDSISGGNGNDQIFGSGGNDLLVGGQNNDTIFGGAGDDQIGGLSGDDVIHGEAGNDVINASGGQDTIFAGAGNDIANGGTGNDRIDGGTGDDILNGDEPSNSFTGQADIIFGSFGSDILRGQGGNDLLDGDGIPDENFENVTDVSPQLAGQDRLIGNNGNDTLIGGWGGDFLNGGNGNDRLVGGQGFLERTDFFPTSLSFLHINVGTDFDTLIGGNGNDTYVFGPQASGLDFTEQISDSGGVLDTFEFNFVEPVLTGSFDFGGIAAPSSTFASYLSTDNSGVTRPVFLVASPTPSIENIVIRP